MHPARQPGRTGPTGLVAAWVPAYGAVMVDVTGHVLLNYYGFFNIRECRVGESEEESLRNLETRPDSLLICEAIR